MNITKFIDVWSKSYLLILLYNCKFKFVSELVPE